MELSENVKQITVEGKEVYLLGTAHVSQKSVDEVHATIAAVDPDSVAVELCPARYESIIQKERWKKMNIFQIVRKGKAVFLLGQLVMSGYYKKIGEKLGVEPGAEMRAAIEAAEGRELVLADRGIEVTLKRVWGHLSFWSKWKLSLQMMASVFSTEDINEEMVEELKRGEALEGLMDSFAKAFPQVKERLIDERDIYLAEKIRQAPGDRIVAVVGAGHVPGIMGHIHKKHPLAPLEVIPSPTLFAKVAKWLIPALVLILLVLGIYRGGTEQAVESAVVWVTAHAALSGLGAALALAHPLTILASCVASPLTSLNPMIAAGWVAGLVQAWVKKPTVEDFEALPQAVSSVGGFWSNPVSRVLLVVILANIGSSLGTFLAGAWMATRVI